MRKSGDDRESLATLLARALLAFTIEADNRFESLVPHRISLTKGSAEAGTGPWLVSVTMWMNFLRYIDDDGTTGRDFCRRAGLSAAEGKQWLTRFTSWWGYLKVTPGPPPTVHFRAGGQAAADVWRALLPQVEDAWHVRFGCEPIERLRVALRTLAAELDPKTQRSLPVLGYGFTTRPFGPESPLSETASLYELLSLVLLAFTIEFERDSKIALALCANVMRVITEDGTRRSDLTKLTGLSKEAVAMSVSYLEKTGYAESRSVPSASRGKIIVLTATGRKIKTDAEEYLARLEATWESRFANGAVEELRDALRALLDRRDGTRSLLAAGLHPSPDGWRNRQPYRAQTMRFIDDPRTLPHYPMVLHRGGWPDGS